MGYVGLIILALVVVALGIPIWAIARAVRAGGKPRIHTKEGRLVIHPPDGGTAEYDIATIDHFLIVTTYYFSASGYMPKKELFLVDIYDKRILFHARDPVNMLSRNYEKIASDLQKLTGKRVESREFVEDLDGHIWTLAEYKNRKLGSPEQWI